MADTKDQAPVHTEETNWDRTWRDEKWQDRRLSQAAQGRTVLEKDLSVMEAIKAYPLAIFWCLTVSTCVIMEGYDTILIGNFYAYPTFQKKYGTFVGVTDHNPSGFQLSAAWQAGLGNASGVGAFFGVLANGYLVALFGQKRVLLCSLVLLSCLIFITFFAPNIEVLTVGELLCGLPWGVFATTAPAYASEVLPLSLRVYLTSYTNMCFIIGQLIAAGVLQGLSGRTDEWAYRIPFAIQVRILATDHLDQLH
jgi:MFS transporter, SP family, general alpha glucoside:H+ symporter